MRIFCTVASFALASYAGAQFLDLNTGSGVGVSAHQWALQRKVASGVSLREIVRDWKDNLGVRVVRLNSIFTDLSFEKQFLATCKAEGMTVLLGGFDYNPAGIENHLPSGWWSKLKTAFPEEWQARTVAVQLVKGLNVESGIKFITDSMTQFKSRNRDYLVAIWAAAGNDVENAVEYVFHNKVGEPGRLINDSSSYAGWSQIMNKGTHNKGLRNKIEASLNVRLPSDATFSRNTLTSEQAMQATWGNRWLDGANHGYWSSANGVPYFGDVGLRPDAAVYTEYGIYHKQLPGRYDLLRHSPANARILIFWPGDGDPFKDLIDVPEIRQVIREKANQLSQS